MTSCNSESSWAITVGGVVHAHFFSQACTLRRSRLFKGAMTVFGIAFVFKVYIFVDFLKVQAGDVEEQGKLTECPGPTAGGPREEGGTRTSPVGTFLPCLLQAESWLRGTESHLAISCVALS